MELLVERCAGVDVHKRSVTVCARTPGEGQWREEIRTFRTFTADLLALRAWLADRQVTLVAMEATGPFWRPVWRVLEGHVPLILANPRLIKQVPGRKTDVADAQWLAGLAAYGLVPASFVPSPALRELRDLTRYRARLVQLRTQETQRVDKILEDAGIKITSVASQSTTMSGRRMIDALIVGERDPAVLAEMAMGRMRPKIPDLKLALDGHFTDHHAQLIQLMVKHADDLGVAITTLDHKISRLCTPCQSDLERLDTIPGVAQRTAQVIIAETGGDMTQFPTAAHLASWAGMCPGHHESAGRSTSGRTRPGNPWLAAALRQAATSAANSKDTYLASQYWQLARRRGKARAAVAVGHTILVIAYHVLTAKADYHELGADWFARRQDRATRAGRLIHQLERLGYTVNLTDTDTTTS